MRFHNDVKLLFWVYENNTVEKLLMWLRCNHLHLSKLYAESLRQGKLQGESQYNAGKGALNT